MKKLFSILFITLLLCSCVNSSKQVANDEKPTTSIDSLTGEWVVSGYKAQLIKNISPMKMGNILSGNTGVCIDKMQGDSAYVLILVNNHEAMTGYIYANKPGKKDGSYAFKSDFEGTDAIDIKLDRAGNDKIIVLYAYDNAGKAISSEKFEYVADFKDINDPCGLTAVNILLANKWTLLDANNKKIGDVEIDSYGNVKGWSEYSTIRVYTDVIFGGEDEIGLSTGNSQGAINYVVEFLGDKVVGYESLTDDEKPTSKRGAHQFTLVLSNPTSKK